MRRVGVGLVAIIALGGVRFLIRTQCWRLCVPGSGGDLTFPHALAAFLAGDAVGSVTPLGLLASEPTKVLLTRHHLATRESVSSLALENLIYSASVIAMVALGAIVLLSTSSLSASLRQDVVWGLIVAIGALITIPVGLMLRLGSSSAAATGRFAPLAGVVRGVQEFARREPGRLGQVFVLDLAYHAVAVVEVFITLQWLMGDRGPTLAMAIVFESLNRIVTVLFKFVPFRVGVDEALNGALAPLVAVDPASGVALAVVRKIRSLFWAAIGLVTVAMHPARSPGAEGR